MRRVVLWMVILMFFSGMVQAAPATFSLFVSGGDESELGFETPSVLVGARAEHKSRFLLLRAKGYYSPTDKVAYGDVTSYGAQGDILLLLPAHLIVGGGGSWGSITFHDGEGTWDSTGAFVSGGWRTDHSLILFSWLFRTDDERYRMESGARAELSYLFGRHVRVGGIFSHYSFKQYERKFSAWSLMYSLEYVF